MNSSRASIGADFLQPIGNGRLPLGKKISVTTEALKAETTVAHGLGYAPKTVILVPTSEATFWVSKAADKTNVYIKGSVAATCDIIAF